MKKEVHINILNKETLKNNPVTISITFELKSTKTRIRVIFWRNLAKR